MIGKYMVNVKPWFNNAATGKPYGGDYVEAAIKRGANYFHVPPKRWNSMTKTEKLRANRVFLDEAIRRRDRIMLATKPSLAKPGSAYAWEIAYLRLRGYRVSPNGRWMLPPPRRVMLTDPRPARHPFNAAAQVGRQPPSRR